MSRAALAIALLLLATGAPARAQDPVVTSLTLFAGTPSGLSRSTDWGATWKPVTDKALDGMGAVRAIMALGTRVLVGGDGGLAVSEDFGQTWKRGASELPAVHALLASRYPAADPTMFVGTSRGLQKSTDAGATFKPTSLQSGLVNRIDWPGPALVLAGAPGVFVSTDGAESFARPGLGLPDGVVTALVLSTFFAVDPVLFAGVADLGLFRSADGGKSWKPAGLAGQRVHDLAWLGPQLYAATDEGVQRSEDLGVTWKVLKTGLAGAVPRRLLFPLAPDSAVEAFVATDRGIYRTPDAGEHWLALGLKGENVLCIATFPPPPPPNVSVKKKR